ncbi:hypothetical protein ABKN59_004914 [Abortiporus biennis]
MLHTPHQPEITHTFAGFHSEKQPTQPRKWSVSTCEPAEVVDRALHALQQAGVQLIEWRALLYKRMNVPVIVKDFSYAVPDDELEGASSILTDIGLIQPPASPLLAQTEGDMHNMGRHYLVTTYTTLSSSQQIILYPLSYTSLQHAELIKSIPSHITNSRCSSILIPRPSAVYASLIRMMLRYPQYCSTRTVLESDISELVGYHLLSMDDGYADPEDDEEWEELEVDNRSSEALQLVRQWSVDEEWREGEEWIGDALAAILNGTGDIGCLPFRSS